MKSYSQKEILVEGFFELMKAIDPKASANLTRPFEQIKDVYKAVTGKTDKAKTDSSTKSSLGIYDPKSKRNDQKFVQKNRKLIGRIAATERDIYNRDIDMSNIKTIDMKLSDGKVTKNIIVTSKNLLSPSSPSGRHLYDINGRFIKKL